MFWCDARMRFTSSDIKPEIRTQALMYGVATWARNMYPTSTFTHLGTIRYFNLTRQEFYFQNMVYPKPALYINTKTLHERVMLLWIKCVLDEDCINPRGAQFTGCNLDLRPKFLYSGCHRHSTSAFNVALWHSYPHSVPYRSDKQLFRIREVETSVLASLKSIITKWSSIKQNK